MNIPIHLVAEGTRLRRTNPDTVATLASSIADVGLLHPITVYARQVMEAGISVDGWGLIAGLHRLEACRQLGHTEIPAHIVSLGELERQIAECDENLCGTKLTPAERALFTSRRKQAYEALHPETRNGETGSGRSKVRQVGEPAKRFTVDTAARTGRSERDVQRDVQRGAGIDEAVLSDIRGTNLDKGVTLDLLAVLPKDQQAGEIERLQNAETPSKSQILNEYGEPTETAIVRLTSIEIESLFTEYKQRAYPYRPRKGYTPPNAVEAGYYAHHIARAEVFERALSKIALVSAVDAVDVASAEPISDANAHRTIDQA